MNASTDHLLAPIFQTEPRFVPSWSPNADPRVSHLPLMGGFHEPFIVISTYLLSIFVGQKLMASREAWNLKYVLIVYNFCLVLLSLYMSVEFVLAALDNDSSWYCEAVNYSTERAPTRMAVICWLYYFSKSIELIETIFFVLRKKNSQVSFLHVFHHTSMVLVWWCVSRWIGGGISFFSALINCIVHVVMYSYYFLSAFGPAAHPYLWWKKYITTFQLLQFVTLTLHDLYVWGADCGYPTVFAMSMAMYMIIFFALFNSFYQLAYRKAAPKEDKKAK
eukprot:scpid23575/ scgid8180/ Elongation of very long chain fatty acids protein 4; 3-keto acyl-CoA synthase Elovl4; ELOVL fatty acid elongase 4